MSSTAAARVPTRPAPRPPSRERQPPRLRVVTPAPRRSAGGLALLSVGLLGFGLLALLLLNISIGKGAYALTALQREQRQLAQERQSLAEEYEAVSSPQELAAKAKKLGMVSNPNTAFVRLPDGEVQGVPRVAQAPPTPTAKPTANATGTAKVTGAANSTGAAARAGTRSGETSNRDRSNARLNSHPKTGTARTAAEPTP